MNLIGERGTMTVLRIVTREMLHRKLNLLFSVLPVVLAVGLFVASITAMRAMDREVTRLMKDLGFNVTVRPEGAERQFWRADFGAVTMPESHLDRIRDSNVVTVRHLLGLLEARRQWRGRDVIVVGTRYEQVESLPGKKPPMGQIVKPGEANIGSDLAQRGGVAVGDTIQLAASDGSTKEFTVASVLDVQGSNDDATIFINLADAQQLLGKPGVLTAIQALSCDCTAEELPAVEADLESLLPGTDAELDRSRAVTRAETRSRFTGFARWAVVLLLAVCTLWVGLLALANVYERRTEIGVLRALGTRSSIVACVFLMRAAFIGLTGALLGFVAGTWPALSWAAREMPQTARKLSPEYGLLGLVLVGAPLLCALAAYLPAMIAVTQDPAVVLREE